MAQAANFTAPANGGEFSVFGWISAPDGAEPELPLLQLSFRAVAGATAAPFFFRSSLFRANGKIARLSVDLTTAPNSLSKFDFNITLLPQTAYFLVLGVSLADKVVKLDFWTPNTGRFLNQTFALDIDFPGYQIGQSAVIELSCPLTTLTTDAEKTAAIANCPLLNVDDFNYILEFFADTERLYLLSPKEATRSDVRLLFDHLADRALITKDIYQLVVPVAGELPQVQPLSALRFTGNSQVILSGVKSFEPTDMVNAVTYYMVLRYHEPLADNLLLLWQGEAGRASFSVNLVRAGDRRYPSVTVIGKSTHVFAPDAANFFVPDVAVRFSVSFVQVGGALFYISIQEETSGKVFYSAVFNDSPLADGTLYLFSGSGKIAQEGGWLEMIQLSVINNAVGPTYRSVHRPASAATSRCGNCGFWLNYFARTKDCLECDATTVFSPLTTSCQPGCPPGFYNYENRCLQCTDPRCTILPRKINFTRLGPRRFMLYALPALPATVTSLAPLYTVNVTGAIAPNDYRLLTTDFPQNRTVIYDFLPGNSNKDLNSTVANFFFTPPAPVFDENKNMVQGADFSLPFSYVNETTTTPPIVSPPIVLPPPLPINPVVENRLVGNHYDPRYEFLNDTTYIDDERNKPYNGYDGDTFRLGEATFAFWVFGLFIGIIGFFFKCPFVDKDQFFYQKFLQTFIMFQYWNFWIFYNSRPTKNLLSFLRAAYRRSTGWHRVFYETAYRNSGGNYDFDSRWAFYGYYRYVEEGALTHFVINFGIIFLIQAFVLILFILAVVITSTKRPYRSRIMPPGAGFSWGGYLGQLDWKAWLLRQFVYKIIITVFLIFVVEVTTFSFYNIIYPSFTHGLFTFSFVFAVIWFLVTIALILLVFSWGARAPEWMFLEENDMRYGFVWHGLDLRSFLRRTFQGIQYVFYWLFAIIIACGFGERIAQGVINFFFMTVFFLYIAVIRPPINPFDQVEQIICHFLLWLAKLFMMILVWDDSGQSIPPHSRSGIGYVVLIVLFILTLWNTFVLLYKLIKMILNCLAAKTMGMQNLPTIREGPVMPLPSYLASTSGVFNRPPPPGPVFYPPAVGTAGVMRDSSYVDRPLAAANFPQGNTSRISPVVATQPAPDGKLTTVTSTVVQSAGQPGFAATTAVTTAAAPSLADNLNLLRTQGLSPMAADNRSEQVLRADSLTSNNIIPERQLLAVAPTEPDLLRSNQRLGALSGDMPDLNADKPLYNFRK